MATALILFTQGGNTDFAGKAVIGVVGDFSAVTVTNGSNTGVVSWKIYLLDAPADSGTFPSGDQPQILAQAADNTPTVAFTPDVAGTYRVMLEVTDSLGSVDRDIRCFAIPDGQGFVKPPYQQNPEPLPVALPIIITRDPRPIKPDEQNYSDNVRGWAGNGGARLIDAFLREHSDLRPKVITVTPYSAEEEDPLLLLVDVDTIAGPATLNLPQYPRVGFVARVGVQGSGFPVTLVPLGMGVGIGGESSLEITAGGVILVWDGSTQWLVLAKGGGSGGGLTPLSNTLYVDLNTSAVTQDGSIGAPFDTVTAAIAAANPDDILIITPGDYSAEGPLTIGKNITIKPTTSISIGVAGLASFFGGVITLGDVSISAGITVFFHGINVGTLDLADNVAGAVLHGCGISAVTGDGTVVGWTSNLAMPFEGAAIIANNCQIVASGTASIDLSGAVCDLVNCQVAAGSAITLTFTGSPGILNVDLYTNYWIGAMETGPGFTLVNGTKTVLGPALTNLSSVRYVDVGTTVVGGNGNIETPFATIQDAVDNLGTTNTTLFVAMGDYSAETITITGAQVEMVGMTNAAIDNWSGPTSITSDSTLVLIDMAEIGTVTTQSKASLVNTSVGTALDCDEGANLFSTDGTNTINGADCDKIVARNVKFGDVLVSEFIEAYTCTFNGDITSDDAAPGGSKLIDCTFTSASTFTFTGSPGVLMVDAATYDSMQSFGVTVVNGTVDVLGIPNAQQVIGWDVTAPEVITLLPVGHAPGVYLISGIAVVTDEAETGTLSREFNWSAPTYGADNIVLGGVSATTTGSKFHDTVTLVSDGTVSVDVTFAGTSITGSTSVDLYCTATLLGVTA